MTRTGNIALVDGSVVLALSAVACTSTKEPTSTDAMGTDATTTTVVGSGPAVRVPENDPTSLGRLFAAWAIGQGADGYVGPCAADPASMPVADTWCSIEGTATTEGQPFRLTHPGATEASAAVLIAPSDGYYRIEDSFTFGEGTPPAWVPTPG